MMKTAGDWEGGEKKKPPLKMEKRQERSKEAGKVEGGLAGEIT
jgi:hypothetical protein